MLILRKMICFSLTLTALWLPWTNRVWAETVSYDGIIEPFEVVNIGAPTEGIVAKVTVERSDMVEKGQILVELESAVEHATLEKARAMATFGGELGQHRARLAFAKRVHERIRRLTAVSYHDKDQAATEIVLTEHLIKTAREKRTLAGLEEKKARALLERCSIKSPISGVVVERYVSHGEYVNTQPLMLLAQIDPLRVEVIVPAVMFGRIIPGMTATIVPELPKYGEHTATVTIVDKIIDSASNTFGVRLKLPNSEGQLPAGLRCLVRFDIDENADGTAKATAQIAP